VELAWVSVAQVAEKIDLPLAVKKEFRIQFVCVKNRTSVRSLIPVRAPHDVLKYNGLPEDRVLGGVGL